MVLNVLTVNREKLLKLDSRSREYNITVIGEEPHVAYNRVGLTTYFDHRKVENLYLNPVTWVRKPTTSLLQRRRADIRTV
jgi:NAD(P)H-nitrite reductase large subunit